MIDLIKCIFKKDELSTALKRVDEEKTKNPVDIDSLVVGQVLAGYPEAGLVSLRFSFMLPDQDKNEESYAVEYIYKGGYPLDDIRAYIRRSFLVRPNHKTINGKFIPLSGALTTQKKVDKRLSKYGFSIDRLCETILENYRKNYPSNEEDIKQRYAKTPPIRG